MSQPDLLLPLQDTNKVLAISRILVAWQPLGLAMGVYDMCSRYLQEREQFGVPLASFQASPLCQAVDRASDCCNVFAACLASVQGKAVGSNVEQRYLLLEYSSSAFQAVCWAVLMPALPYAASLCLAHCAQRCAGCLISSCCRDLLMLLSKLKHKEVGLHVAMLPGVEYRAVLWLKPSIMLQCMSDSILLLQRPNRLHIDSNLSIHASVWCCSWARSAWLGCWATSTPCSSWCTA